MSEKINLSKLVYNKNQYQKVIDNSFNELGVKTISEQLENQPTVDDFFKLYNELFYEIDTVGNTNSHEYIIKKSTEYIGFEEVNEEIEALQNEIAQLRIELLEEQKKNLAQ
jgi:uncharacterized small protein (DUF1192 family)